MKSAAQRGEAVLLSSHHMSELALVVDHVVMVDQGQVIRSGPVSQFIAEDVQRTYFESDDLAAALHLLASHGLAHDTHGRGAIVFGCSPEEVGRLLFLNGPGASTLYRMNRTIEETYFDTMADRQGSVGRD